MIFPLIGNSSFSLIPASLLTNEVLKLICMLVYAPIFTETSSSNCFAFSCEKTIVLIVNAITINRPALLYPNFNFRCNKEADPCCAITIISAASLNNLSLSAMSISIPVPPSSPTYSGNKCASG